VNKFCDDDCEYLHPTEKEQSKRKEDHKCAKYGQTVFHLGNHPKLVKCEACSKN